MYYLRQRKYAHLTLEETSAMEKPGYDSLLTQCFDFRTISVSKSRGGNSESSNEKNETLLSENMVGYKKRNVKKSCEI